MTGPRPTLVVARAAALLALGALGVHQLRYLIAYGPAGGEALHREGHAYLAGALPVVVALAAATLVAILLRAALGGAARGARRHSGATRALLYAGALVFVFSAQELTEGALAAGHPAGLAAILGGGAWVAAPLALAFGFVTAIAERLLDHAETAIAGAASVRSRPRRAAEPRAILRAPPRIPLAASPLAFGLARRPPPVAPLV